MAIRTLNYTVTQDGVVPAYEQNAGTQYDHRKTQLRFTLDNEIYNEIIANIGEGEIVYRFDCYDGEGTLHLGEIKALNGLILEPYPLEYWVTKFGGKIKICLVITNSKNEITDTEFSYQITVHLNDLVRTGTVEDTYQSISTLAKQSVDCVKQVEGIKDEMAEMHNALKNIELMLEEGEWIFNAEQDSNIDVNFIVENEFDENSHNLITNGTVTTKLNEIDNKIQRLTDNMVKEVYDSIISEVLLCAHPIGSYYWSSETANPEILFGGTWERVKDVFVLAAGSEYGCGTTGGEAKHMLTEDEMPSHMHIFNPNARVDGVDFIVPTVSSSTGVSSISERGTAHQTGHWASQTWGTDSRGNSQAHNNMPPYITAYCWKRTA